MIVPLPVLSQIDKVNEPVLSIIRPVEKPKEQVKHIVQKNETLTSISELHSVPINRLWAANPELLSPDLIEPEMSLIVPENTDVLPERPLPISPQKATLSPRTSVNNGANNSGGWSFPYGWCTWFASQQRPDVPVRGNAADWIAWANSTVPQVGAIAVNTSGLGHVAIVIEITDTQVKVRHMNWVGFGVVSEDWIDKTYWQGYIL
jgi:hypothetical protein